ncbi:rhamnan synthesis F family protein [Leptospira perdikensis]|uniref:rhamnan synthesis F family protein n=1 Tax=Leptospira perdikensis TaxID=2484948 RepID=UPI00142D47C3|nr:rhamnan synthesis F family protein [Leptospira perdikensis]
MAVVPEIYVNTVFREKQFNRLVLFSTFSTTGKVSKNLTFYLRKLHELGSDIVLIDTSPISLPEEIESIRPFIKQYIWRENFGYDFGSWKVGLSETKDWKSYEQIVLTNDSVYGPLTPLQPIFSKFVNTDIDVWGLTDSYEFDYHLMSYFLVFQNNVLKSEAFERFWNQFVFYPTRWKKLLILEYEVGGTKYWKKNHFKMSVFIPFISLSPNTDKTYYINPTHVFWNTIITEHGFPFLKRDLIKALLSKNLTHEINDLLETNQYYPINHIDLLNN